MKIYLPHRAPQVELLGGPGLLPQASASAVLPGKYFRWGQPRERVLGFMQGGFPMRGACLGFCRSCTGWSKCRF